MELHGIHVESTMEMYGIHVEMHGIHMKMYGTHGRGVVWNPCEKSPCSQRKVTKKSFNSSQEGRLQDDYVQ